MDFWSVAEIVWLTAAFSGVLVAAPKYAENWVEQLQGLREDIGAHYEQQFLDLIDQYHRSAKGWYQEVRCDSPGATIFQPTCDFLGNFLKFAERIENEPGYLASEFAKNPKMPWDYWHEVESLKDVQVAQNDLLAMLTNWERVGIHSPYRASRMINRMRETLNKHHIGPDEKRDYALHISGCDESTGGEVCDTVGSALSTTEFYEVQDVPSLSRLLNRLNASVAVGEAFLSREPSSFRDRYVDAEPGLEDFYRSRPQADFDLSLPPVSAVELVPFAARTDLEQPKGLEAKMIWVWRIGAFAPLLLGAAFGVRYAKALAAF